MHSNHDLFIQAIKDSKKVNLTFLSQEDGSELFVQCAPMDYNPGRRAKDESDYYYFWCSDSELWCFEKDKSSYVLTLPSNRIVSMELTENSFDPSEFNTADIHWFLARGQGLFDKVFMFIKRPLKFFTKPDDKRRADRRL